MSYQFSIFNGLSFHTYILKDDNHNSDFDIFDRFTFSSVNAHFFFIHKLEISIKEEYFKINQNIIIGTQIIIHIPVNDNSNQMTMVDRIVQFFAVNFCDSNDFIVYS